MPKTKIRKWCEETAREFGSKLTQKGKEWQIVQINTGKIAYRSKYLVDVQKFLLNEIMKYMGKRMKVGKTEKAKTRRK